MTDSRSSLQFDARQSGTPRRSRLLAAGRRVRKVLVVMITPALVLLIAATPAFADTEQEGYRVVGAGSTVFIQVSSYAPKIHCLVYSTSAWGTSRGIQTGVYDCASGYSIDTSCTGHYTFVENWTGNNNYHCWYVGGWSSSQFGAQVTRKDSTTWAAYISGTYMGHDAGSWTGNPYNYVWNEYTGNPACPSGFSTNVTFSGWEYRPPNQTHWDNVTSTTSYSFQTNPQNRCMTAGSYNTSTHGFSVIG